MDSKINVNSKQESMRPKTKKQKKEIGIEGKGGVQNCKYMCKEREYRRRCCRGGSVEDR